MVIYLITNIISGNRYIGQTIFSAEKRWRDHTYMLDNCFYLNRELKQFGKSSFKVEVLEECSSLDSLNIRESFWIKKLNTVWPNGLNANYGGGNRKHSEETKQKIKESQKGRHVPEYRRLKISESLRGRKLSSETIEKRTQAWIKNNSKQNSDWVRRRVESWKITMLKKKEKVEEPHD